MITIEAMTQDGAGQVVPASLGLLYDLAVSGSTVTASPASDVVAIADAALGYTRQLSRTTMQAYGGTSTALFGSSGVTGDSVGGSTVRLARVADPDDGAKFAWRMRCAKTDPDTASANAKRAEFSYPTNTAQYGRWTTTGFKFRQQSYPGHTDEWLIAQIHAGGSSSLINPWLAFYYKANTLRVDCRYDNAVMQSMALPQTAGAWNTVVVECYLHATDGRVKVWMNGALRMDYWGVLAESTPRSDGYWKSGIYEWDASTQWDDAYPVREIYTKGLYIVLGQKQAEMHALLAAV